MDVIGVPDHQNTQTLTAVVTASATGPTIHPWSVMSYPGRTENRHWGKHLRLRMALVGSDYCSRLRYRPMTKQMREQDGHRATRGHECGTIDGGQNHYLKAGHGPDGDSHCMEYTKTLEHGGNPPFSCRGKFTVPVKRFTTAHRRLGTFTAEGLDMSHTRKSAFIRWPKVDGVEKRPGVVRPRHRAMVRSYAAQFQTETGKKPR